MKPAFRSVSHDAPGCAQPIDLDAVEPLTRAAIAPIAEIETVPIMAATGRTLASDILAPQALPLFDHAAVDGYGLPAALLGRAPVSVPVDAEIRAGGLAAGVAGSTGGGAVRIFTGAPVSADLAAIVAQERAERLGGAIRITDPVRAGANIRRRGEDLAEGALALAGGIRLEARHIALLAALGLDRVPVRRRIRAALLAFGDELTAPGAPLRPGRIYDANTAMAASFLTRWGVDIIASERIPDDLGRMTDAIGALVAEADLLVTSGGMSVGEADHVRAAVTRCGGRWRAMAVRMKPGKPAAFATLGEAALLGLPGNPFAAIVAMAVIGAPIVAALEGRAWKRPWRPANACFDLERRPGRAEFFPAARVEAGGVAPVVDRLGKGGSARLAPLAAADGLGLIAAETGRVMPGAAIGYADFSALD